MLTGTQTIETLKGPGLDLDEISQERRKVLVVEDEPDTVYLLKQILRMAGYNVASAETGIDALKKVNEYNPDLVLLDIMLPEMDGWETMAYLREMADTPVIIVSAITKKPEVVRGLRLGADDYLTKPFYNDEVVARVQAVLRRSGRSQEVNNIVFPKIGMVIELKNQEVSVNRRIIQLTSREFAVLAVLARRAPTAVDYRTISLDVWGEDNSRTRNRTKYLVYLLRQKLTQAGVNPDFIVNVDRLGYRLMTDQ